MKIFWLKTAAEYVCTSYYKNINSSNGGFVNGTLVQNYLLFLCKYHVAGLGFIHKVMIPVFICMSRDCYTPSLCPLFMAGEAVGTVNLKYSYKDRFIIQGKWG